MPPPRPHVLVAPDSFKGTFDAAQVAAGIGRGLERAGASADLCPVADGGEGTLDVLLARYGAALHAVGVHDPLGRPLQAHYGLAADGT
ncbi:MAG: glycerate kinase, partial [Conexibacter sp.]